MGLFQSSQYRSFHAAQHEHVNADRSERDEYVVNVLFQYDSEIRQLAVVVFQDLQRFSGQQETAYQDERVHRDPEVAQDEINDIFKFCCQD